MLKLFKHYIKFMEDYSKTSTTVLFNGDCEICSKEICIYQSYGASEGLPIDFKDINNTDLNSFGLTRDETARQLHVLKNSELLIISEQGIGEHIIFLPLVSEVSKLMLEAGLITIVSFISPFKAERGLARDIIGDENFIEAYINTPLSVAEERDVKGLYKKARNGEIPNFTGIGSPYEAPDAPELDLLTTAHSADELADQIIAYLEDNDYL